MHGGLNIDVAGPCLGSKDRLQCKFGHKSATPGAISSRSKHVRCTVPMVNHTKAVPLKLSLDNGETFPFRGHFQYGECFNYYSLSKYSIYSVNYQIE